MSLDQPSSEDTGNLTPQGILDALNADDTDEVQPEDKIDLEDTDDQEGEAEDKETEEKDESDEEEKDDEEELDLKDDEDEEDDDEEDESSFATPPRKKEILKKYPNIFKEFKYLEVALYRDQRFVEVFPTVQDAKDAAEKGEYLDRFESELMEGNTKNILQLVKEQDPNAFNNILDNYVEVLGEIDSNAQIHVISGVAKKIIVSLARDGQGEKDSKLSEAARVLNEYLFGKGEFRAQTKLGKEKSDDDDDTERTEWLEERFNVINGDLSTRIENSIKSTIDANIDPREAMTDYVKQQAMKDVLQQMQQTIGDDRRFTSIIDNLWRKAADDNFSTESQRKIRSAYLSKAKTVLPTVIKKVRQAALKGLGKRTTGGRKKNVERGRTTPTERRSKGGKEKSRDGKGMSTLEFFSQG